MWSSSSRGAEPGFPFSLRPEAWRREEPPGTCPAILYLMSENTSQQNPTNGLATASLIAGIVALVAIVTPFGAIFQPIAGVLAIVFGIMGLLAAKKRSGAGHGIAIAGLAIGAGALVLATVINAAGGLGTMLNS